VRQYALDKTACSYTGTCGSGLPYSIWIGRAASGGIVSGPCHCARCDDAREFDTVRRDKERKRLLASTMTVGPLRPSGYVGAMNIEPVNYTMNAVTSFAFEG